MRRLKTPQDKRNDGRPHDVSIPITIAVG